MVRLVLAALALVLLGPRPARAEGPARAEAPTSAVALLPLDADQRLAIYGQPVASEVARALAAGDIDVVVVGPRMAVPERARLILDGTIASPKGDAVVLTMRLRDPADGTVVATMSSTAPTLASIDTAAAELSARVLPAVRAKIAALRSSAQAAPPAPPGPTPPPRARPLLVTIDAVRSASSVAPLRAALSELVPGWAGDQQRAPVMLSPEALGRPHVGSTLAARGGDLAIAFELIGYEVSQASAVPLARARVRVRIAGPRGIAFERVVVTDSIVGDRGMPPGPLATRTAREVLAILRPHLVRVVGAWR